MHEPSIFEKIVSGDIPSSKIRENDEFLAILDIFPNCKGQTLVFPKKRYDSDISLMPDDVYEAYMLAVKDVMELLKKGLGVKRVGMIVEGMGVHHVHVKLYPMHGLGDEWKPMIPDAKVRFDTYDGHLTTYLGDMKQKADLDLVAQEIATHA